MQQITKIEVWKSSVFCFRIIYEGFHPSLIGLLDCLTDLLDCFDWVPNRGACIDACLTGDVTRSFRIYTMQQIINV